MRISVVSFFFFLLAGSLWSQEKPETFFYIISVPPPPGFAELPSLKERANELEEFIVEIYRPDSDHLFVLESPDETAAAEIRRVLYSKIPNHPADSIIFFFLLTHAKVQWYQGVSSRARADLQIVVSDTTKENTVGTSVHGLELLASFVHAPPRSQVFAFIDSCDSGGLGTPLARSLAAISNLLGSKMYVMTSSAAGESSYAGNFTKALVDVWRGQGVKCVGKSYFVEAINTRLASSTQRVQEIVPFTGPCLNFANKAVGLLIVWNTGEGSIYLELPDGSRSDYIDVHDDQPTIVPLPRDVQFVGVFKSSQRLLRVLELDFSASPVTLYSIEEDKKPAVLVQRFLKTSDDIGDLGFGREAQAYKAFAAGFARESGEGAYAQLIEASIDRSLASEELLAALDYHRVAPSLEGADQKEVGDLLAGLGRFQAAYSVYLNEFEGGNASPEVFGSLYTALVLANQEHAAKELREKFTRLFERSSEAIETKEILNSPDADHLSVVTHGLENAASRTGLVVDPLESTGVMMRFPP